MLKKTSVMQLAVHSLMWLRLVSWWNKQQTRMKEKKHSEPAKEIFLIINQSRLFKANVRYKPFVRLWWYLIKPGICVPWGTGPLVGSTKRPLEFCTLSLRKIDTWYWGNKTKNTVRETNTNRRNVFQSIGLTLICMSWKKIRRVCLISWNSPFDKGVYI